jgi:hypothetical protein
MSNHQRDNVDYTFEAVSRLRRLLHEHDGSGAEDTPFHLGIRAALEDFDAAADRHESAAWLRAS